MLPQQSASRWFSKIYENHQSGNCQQRVLGLRLIFDSVLLEMFPDIPEQGFYLAGINKIFTSDVIHKYGKRTTERLKNEFHRLRQYLNSVQHSQIEADEVGYMRSLKRLIDLISFCSATEPTEEISNLLDRDKSCIDNKHAASAPMQIQAGSMEITPKITPIFIFDRGSIANSEVVYQLELGINGLFKKIKGIVNKFIVVSLNHNQLTISLPLSNTKHRFTYDDKNSSQNLDPLREIIVNSKITKFAVFFLSDAAAPVVNVLPEFLSESEIMLTIGIANNIDSKDLQKNRFDKFVKSENLNQFFDWAALAIENL